MKKIVLFVSALMIAGASFAHDGDKTGKKACCKDGDKKEACAKDHGKDGNCAKSSGKKACCKKDNNADQKKSS